MKKMLLFACLISFALCANAMENGLGSPTPLVRNSSLPAARTNAIASCKLYCTCIKCLEKSVVSLEAIEEQVTAYIDGYKLTKSSQLPVKPDEEQKKICIERMTASIYKLKVQLKERPKPAKVKYTKPNKQESKSSSLKGDLSFPITAEQEEETTVLTDTNKVNSRYGSNPLPGDVEVFRP